MESLTGKVGAPVAFFISTPDREGKRMDAPEVVRDSAATRRVRRYLEISKQIKDLTTEKERVLSELVSSIGHNAIIDGHKLTQVVQQRVAYAQAVKVLMPEADLSPWTSEKTYWRLT